MARRKSRALPQRTPAEVRGAYPEHRQSTLASFDNCHLLALFEAEGYAYDNHRAAIGILFHRFAAAVLETLRETGEAMVPVAEALEIMYETCAQRDVPDAEVVCVPAWGRRMLRILAVVFARDNTFDMRRVVGIERRLHATVRVRDAEAGTEVERGITGAPDVLLADPPRWEGDSSGAVVLDWKTTQKPPPEYRGAKPNDNPATVSYDGYYQQRFYALLVMANFPSVQRVTLREFYPLAEAGDRVRKATVTREQLEHVEREVAAGVELLDRALLGGSRGAMWRPSPGRHCNFCPKPTRCPIEADVRVFGTAGEPGGIAGPGEARRFAAEYVLAGRTRSGLHEALKAWHESTGEPIPVRAAKGRYEIRWGRTKGGGRRFGDWPVETSDRGPLDENLEAAFAEAAERKAAASG